MFIRNESFRDFIQFYPLISILVAFQLTLWLIGFLIPPLGDIIYNVGVGQNYLISQGEYWRLITPIFLHSPYGIGHILFNSFALVIFGPALEQMLGKGKLFFIFIFTGVVANVFTYIVEPSPTYTHLGASGAIYGIIGLYIFMALFEKKLIDPQSAKLVIIISVIGLIMTFIRPGINIAGHLFGFIAGFALGPILLRNARAFNPWQNARRRKRKTYDGDIGFDPNRWNKRRYRYKKYIGPILWGIIALLVLLGLIGSVL